MIDIEFSRREWLKTSAAAAAGWLALFGDPRLALPDQQPDEELVPFLNIPPAKPNMLDWETLDSWLTPQDQVFSVSHYDEPAVEPSTWKLEITGLVDHPRILTFEDIKQLPQEERLMTLECSGNGAGPGFMGAVYNSRWTGTPLASLLKECGIRPDAPEIVFYGEDQKDETIRKVTVPVPFGRSMSIEDAMNPNILLAYLRNGEPLEKRNGAPLRLIVPGWYGIANVKWLKRIEVRDKRYMGRFMGRDYVTIRGEKQDDDIVFIETSVTKMNLKSIIARVTRTATVDGAVPVKAYGAVWNDGTEIEKVEVKCDDGVWQLAQLAAEPRSKYSWTFFSVDLGRLAPGKHTIVSRATDANGRVQPTADDDEIALKKTYWEAYQQVPREIEL